MYLSDPSPHIFAYAALKAYLNRIYAKHDKIFGRVMRWHIKAVSVSQSSGMEKVDSPLILPNAGARYQ